MLPIPVLDDERFREITENARSMIPRLSPGWTDFNYHDPGITFLELFAFLKESQQYYLDQIGPRNRQKYLKLLGMTVERRAPARVGAVLSGSAAGRSLPRGIRLLAGDIPFETERPVRLSGGRLRGGFTWDGSKRTEFAIDSYAEAGKLRLEVFGPEPTPGAAWYLRFDGPLSAGQPIRLWLGVTQDWPVRRCPVEGDDFTPLAELTWEYLTPSGWQDLAVEADETRGLLFGGALTLRPQGDSCPATAAPAEEQDRLDRHLDDCWLRVRLVGGTYDVPPVLTGLSDEIVPAVQRETAASCRRLSVENGVVEDDSLLAKLGEYQIYCRADDGCWQAVAAPRDGDSDKNVTRFSLPPTSEGEALLLCWRSDFSARRHLAVGSGFPHQNYELGEQGQIYESFSLLVAEADRPDAWSSWDKVEDFDGSGPSDCHYLLDEEAGTVTFGDCVHGMAPEGEILIAGYAVTLGPGGNVKAERLEKAHPIDLALCALGEEDLRVRNPDNAAGGRSRESEEDCFLRCKRLLRRSERAVTYSDYERLVRETPGLMIANCKAVPVDRLPRQDGSLAEDCVTVVVEPYAPGPFRTLSKRYEENILRHLEDRRMLGAKLSVLAPEYVGITIYAEILSQPHYVDARARIQAAVAAFFQEGWEFGRPVRYSVLYGIIDTLDCVSGVETLTIDAQGKGITRDTNGDVLLPYNGLAVLQSAGYQIRAAE